MALKLAKVLISDSVDSSCREILERNGVPVDYKPGMSKEELLSVIKVSHGRFLTLCNEPLDVVAINWPMSK